MKRHHTMYSLVALMILLLLLPMALSAQGVTTAAISGKITGKGGEPLPGVNVVAVHNPSGTKYGTSSREDGRYTLPNLRVGGPYTVTASIVGYQKQASQDIYLRLSQTLDLNFTMVEEAIQAGEVVVTGERNSVFSTAHEGAVTNVTRENIDKLPALTRNFQDYYKMSPYFSPSTATGSQGNALGRNSKYNNIQVDGVNFNDLFGLGGTGTFGGQATLHQVTAISLDAIEEFQMVISPYDVRQSDFTGAGINAITRSGTNKYSGSAFYYGRNENFAGKAPNLNDALKTKLQGFTDYQTGGRVGGPIIENELFFFGNAEIARYKQPLSRVFGQQINTTYSYVANADSLRQLRQYLQTRYGYDPGDFAALQQISQSEKAFIRFDYNLSENHKLTARYNYLHAIDDNTPSRGRGPTDIYFDYGRYKLQNKTHSAALQLSSLFSNEASNEFIVGYNDQFDNPVYYGSPFPTLYIATSDTTKQFKGTQNLILGAEEFRHYNELGQKVFEITDNFSWYLPGHTLTFGAKASILKFRNLFIPDGFGQYAYSSIARFLQDLPPDGAPGFSPYTYRYSATSDPQQEANWKANEWGFYAQDELNPIPALKITAGLRMDIPVYITRANYNKTLDTTLFNFLGNHYRTDTIPNPTISWSPRVGFNWSLNEERTSQLRGGVGVFYGRFPFVWVSNQYSNTGVDFYTRGTVAGTDTIKHFNPDPYNQPKGPATLPSAEVDLTDINFKAPSIFRWNLALDYKLPYGVVATIEGIFSTTINDVFTQNINLRGLQSNIDSGGTVRANGALTPNGRIVGEGREMWGLISATGSGSPATQWIDAAHFSPGIFLVTNTSKGFNNNIVFQLQRDVNPWTTTLGYTWGMAMDVNSNNSTTASSQWRFNPTQGNPNDPVLAFSQWDRRHHILAAVTYRHDWEWNGLATTVGFYYNGQSGRPFSYMVVGDVNGDGRTDNDLMYVPRDAYDVILTSSSGAPLPKSDAAYGKMMAYINADSYLKDRKGMMSERSGAREPWSHQVDFRLSQEIPTVAGQKLEITLDILNILNLLNSNWGWVRNTGANQTVSPEQFRGFVTTPGPDYGKAKYQWLGAPITDGIADPFVNDDLLSRWQMQLGIRYTL